VLFRSINVDINDLEVRIVDFSDASSFLGAYHYLGFVHRRGLPIGCYFNGVLIAVCLFGGLTRQNSATRFGLKTNQCREIIRFAISPFYHNKNLGSWFLSRAMGFLDEKVKIIISFADKTANHIGTLYMAANFRLDGECGESYAYVNSDGYVMHKKTMWDFARKNGMDEEQMASKSGYQKVSSLGKFRYIYER